MPKDERIIKVLSVRFRSLEITGRRAARWGRSRAMKTKKRATRRTGLSMSMQEWEAKRKGEYVFVNRLTRLQRIWHGPGRWWLTAAILDRCNLPAFNASFFLKKKKAFAILWPFFPALFFKKKWTKIWIQASFSGNILQFTTN